MRLYSGHFRPVILSSYEQSLERGNTPTTLEQEFGNCP